MLQLKLFDMFSCNKFKDIFEDLLKLIFPPLCVHCKCVTNEKYLCKECKLQITLTQDYLSPNKNPTYNRLCCEDFALKYGMAIFTFIKNTPIQSLMHNLKYNNKKDIGYWIGEMFGTTIINSNCKYDFDCIIPIPLHKKRLLMRGYNQSEVFAQGLAAKLEIPIYNDVVKRVKNTQTQTQKNKEEREQNMNDAFSIVDVFKITDKHVLLVDDVITTGATIRSCGKTITNGTHCTLSVVTMCITT